MLKEFDKLGVQRRYELANGGIDRRLHEVYILFWILLILQPDELIGNKTILI